MIQEVIHYCWFGENQLSESEIKCIDSWKKFFPGYAIKRWDETNFNICCCDYVQEAYRAKKWAFVSDYARFKILYEYGGLYFDTDVEVIRSFYDILQKGPFMGFETDPSLSSDASVAPGLGLSANPGLSLYRTILDSYEDDHFCFKDGSLNYRTVVERVTDILIKEGLENKPGIQEIEGVRIYPSEFFNPMNLETGELCITSETRSIHHYDASWQPEALRRVGSLKQTIYRRAPYLPVKLRSALAWITYVVTTGDFGAIKERY